MRRFLNILLLVLTLLAMTAMGIYFAHSHFNDSLDDVNITITRNHENGFLDYEEIFNTVMNICEQRLENLEKELSELRDENASMRAQWENEKKSITDLKAIKQHVEEVKHQIEEAERYKGVGVTNLTVMITILLRKEIYQEDVYAQHI